MGGQTCSSDLRIGTSFNSFPCDGHMKLACQLVGQSMPRAHLQIDLVGADAEAADCQQLVRVLQRAGLQLHLAPDAQHMHIPQPRVQLLRSQRSGCCLLHSMLLPDVPGSLNKLKSP